MNTKIAFILLFIIMLNSCQEWFPASPYAIREYSDVNNLNNSNIQKINTPSFASPEYLLNGANALVLGFISDTHYYYDNTAKVIGAINQDTTVSVILHGGDITEKGLPDEFVFVARQLVQLNRPFLTAIGNHDHLGTGDAAFREVFGEVPNSCSRKTSFSTSIKADSFTVRVIVWDNNVWEVGNSTPDFNWLENELSDASNQNEEILVLAHIPPWTDQFSSEMAERYNTLLTNYSASLSIHGHFHNSIYKTKDVPEPFKSSGVRYAIIGSTNYNSYMKVIMNGSELDIVRVEI